jgi:hypothetical protein
MVSRWFFVCRIDNVPLGTKSRAAAIPLSMSPVAVPRRSITKRIAPVFVRALTACVTLAGTSFENSAMRT